MARLPRLGVAGWPHLVVQRVHDGQLLARDEQDGLAILEALREASRQYGLSIHAYCLAPDHLHLLATPSTDDALSLVMQALGRRYVAAYNRRHGRQGGLWAGRYRSTVLDPAQYLLDGMVFVESHAWRAGQVSRVEDDVWSSVRHHLGIKTDPLVSDHALFWGLGNTPFERDAAWRRRLETGLSALQIEGMAQAMHKGWALMPVDAAGKLEASAGRRLAPRPRGRPRKPPVSPESTTD
ncbi:MAG TPA: transposase [Aquabacterium sp.]|uniref:transposase n=1 Tax=Aquabacterium sp. TaxID=1872578 RepID=UPI002E376998|nr:transposase [Aquabacterium sp.]HEX5356496.1 transposase [Aquabacterium sp.]